VALSDLLGLWSRLVTQLAGSSCRLSSAYSEIQRITNNLAALREVQTDEAIAGEYDTAIQLINQYTIDSSYDLIQFSYILAAPGRHAPFEQMHRYLMSELQEQPAFELELVNFHGQ
jgi:hypothetical protein